MAEIRIIAEMRFKPGGKEKMKDALLSLVEGSRGEAGNVAYEVTEDLADPDHVFVIERWASQEAIDEHNRTPHFTGFMSLAKDNVADSKITLLKKIL